MGLCSGQGLSLARQQGQDERTESEDRSTDGVANRGRSGPLHSTQCLTLPSPLGCPGRTEHVWAAGQAAGVLKRDEDPVAWAGIAWPYQDKVTLASVAHCGFQIGSLREAQFATMEAQVPRLVSGLARCS